MKIKLLILLLIGSKFLFPQDKNINYTSLSVSDARDLIETNNENPNFIILDVRRISEYNQKHIRNAVEFDYYQNNFSDNLDTLIKTKIYLVHCASGGRSGNVCNQMQTMGFAEFYNMSGGINAWLNAGYDTTKITNPIAMPISDTLVVFSGVNISHQDSITVTITNYGNDTLKFNSITDISNTEFATNFDLSRKLTGLMNYSFNIYYTPTDIINDSIIFTIKSNSSDLIFLLKSNILTTNISCKNNHKEILIYPNPVNNFMYIKGENINKIELINSSGNLILQKNKLDNNITLNVGSIEQGAYLLRIYFDKKIINKKIIKI